MLSTTTSRVLRRYTSRPGAQRASAIPGLTASSCRRSLSTHAFLPAALPKSSKSGVISHCRASGYATAARETFATKRVSATRIPSEADMDAAELDAELLPAEEIALQMSDRAAEVRAAFVAGGSVRAKLYSAYSYHCSTRGAFGGATHQCRVWWMSRISVQAGARGRQRERT
jgi:hypothetical protein